MWVEGEGVKVGGDGGVAAAGEEGVVEGILGK